MAVRLWNNNFFLSFVFLSNHFLHFNFFLSLSFFPTTPSLFPSLSSHRTFQKGVLLAREGVYCTPATLAYGKNILALLSTFGFLYFCITFWTFSPSISLGGGGQLCLLTCLAMSSGLGGGRARYWILIGGVSDHERAGQWAYVGLLAEVFSISMPGRGTHSCTLSWTSWQGCSPSQVPGWGTHSGQSWFKTMASRRHQLSESKGR